MTASPRRGMPPKQLSSTSRLALFAEPDAIFDVAYGPELNSRPPRASLRRRATCSHLAGIGAGGSLSGDVADDGAGGGGRSATRPGLTRRHVSVPSDLTLQRSTLDATPEEDDGLDETTRANGSNIHGAPQSRPDDGAEEVGAGRAAALLFLGIVVSSSFSNLSLQRLNALRPGCGQLITLLQYVATTLEKSPRASSYLLRPRIPPLYHAAFVVLMFVTAWTSNRAMESGMPFGHFLVVKNTNLVFSMLLGALALGRRYSAVQVAGVVLVTVGVVVCVLEQNDGEAARGGKEEEAAATAAAKSHSAMLVGAFLCACSTLSISALGCLQERAFKAYSSPDDDINPADEALFNMHLLGLPFFFVGSGMSSVSSHLSALFSPPSSPLSSAVLLLANIGATAVLKRCFVGLLGMGGALTATMAVTVSRTLGVVISELLEEDEEGRGPTLVFWSGAGLVALGSIAYVLGGRTGGRNKAGSTSSSKKKEE